MDTVMDVIKRKKGGEYVSGFDGRGRLIQLKRTANRALQENDVENLLRTWSLLEELGCVAAKTKDGHERELFEDLRKETDEFLTGQAQIFKDAGYLEIALIAHGSVERIRRTANSPGLYGNLAIQARLLTRVCKPEEAVRKAQEALTLAPESDELAKQMREILMDEGKVPVFGIFGE
jgi:hypothetical protein